MIYNEILSSKISDVIMLTKEIRQISLLNFIDHVYYSLFDRKPDFDVTLESANELINPDTVKNRCEFIMRFINSDECKFRFNAHDYDKLITSVLKCFGYSFSSNSLLTLILESYPTYDDFYDRLDDFMNMVASNSDMADKRALQQDGAIRELDINLSIYRLTESIQSLSQSFSNLQSDMKNMNHNLVETQTLLRSMGGLSHAGAADIASVISIILSKINKMEAK